MGRHASPVSPPRASNYRGLIETAFVGVLGAGAAAAGFAALAPAIVDFATYDFWFESDPPAVLDQLTTLQGAKSPARIGFHPLLSMLVFPTRLLRWVVGGSSEAAVGMTVAVAAGLALGLFHFALRLSGLSRVEAAVFTALLASSSAWVFFAPVPESYVFGALTLMIVFALAAWTDHRGRLPTIVYATVAAGTVGATITLGLSGLMLLLGTFRLRRALTVGAASLGVLAIGWAIQSAVLAVPFLPWSVSQSSLVQSFASSPTSGFVAKATALLAHGMVIPSVSIRGDLYLSVQGAPPAGGDPIAAVALVGWAGLLGCGLLVAFRKRSGVALVLLGSYLSQFMVYLGFGLETFMYTLHVVPLAVALAAMGATTRNRSWMVPVAVVVTVLGGFHNVRAFQDAANRLLSRSVVEHAFFDAVERQTEPNAVLVYGAYAHPPAGTVQQALPPPQQTPEWLRGRARLSMARRGFFVRPREWSATYIDELAERGATHFVTSFVTGLDQNPEFTSYLAREHQLIERTADWAIFRLVARVERVNKGIR